MAIETVTIINNSGKIISNGKHLFSLFKEAKASYDEKKAAVKAERAIKRSQTFDVTTEPRYTHEAEYVHPQNPRRISHEDVASHTSSRRSHRSRATATSHGHRHRSQSQTRPALTASNLQTLSEVSATAPSRAPVAYRSPYAETAPWETALSRPSLARAPTMPVHGSQYNHHYDQYEGTETIVPTPRHSMHVHRARSDPSLQDQHQQLTRRPKEIDMNLAYGNIPPDLASRVDLDPAYQAAEKERRAKGLTQHIEGLLTEAHCLQHTATHMIKHLQQKPEAAAAVALTLAELSSLLGSMSPGFLGAIKASSPAVFALLASPQFLIAAGLTVGVTVVMFGGWKIVKRMKEAKQLEAAAHQPMAFAAHPAGYPPTVVDPYAHGYGPGVHGHGARAPYPMTEGSGGFDEALVIEEELSTIESWRRGIEPLGSEAESADVELISPEADRAVRSQYGDDARSTRTSRTKGTARTSRTTRTHRSHRSHRERGSRDDEIDERDVPERSSSSRAHTVHEVDGESLADSERSRRSHRSHHSHHSHHSSRSKRTVKAIEDGSKDRKAAEEFDLAVRGGPSSSSVSKTDNMLKSLFKKKKDKEEKVRGESSLVPA